MGISPPLAALGIAALAATAIPADAHAHLISSIPAADASVTVPPLELAFHFTEQVEPAFTGVTLRDTSGVVVPTGATTLDTADPTAIAVPIQSGLADGRYTVGWHAVALDGHKTSGTYDFIVMPKTTTP